MIGIPSVAQILTVIAVALLATVVLSAAAAAALTRRSSPSDNTQFDPLQVPDQQAAVQPIPADHHPDLVDHGGRRA